MAGFAEKLNLTLDVGNVEANKQNSTYWPKMWDHEFIDHGPTPLRHAWIQLAQLCQFNYWCRLWIIQEVCSAKQLKLLSGSDNLDWTEFKDIPQGPFKRLKMEIAFPWKRYSLSSP